MLGVQLEDEAPIVVQVFEESGAETAGVKTGDRIVSVDGEETPSREALVNRIRSFKTPLLNIDIYDPVIGYDEAAKLAKEALKSGRTIRELALERGIAADELDRLLDPASMTEPGLGGGPAGG